mmetsp:Transcript_56298/g.161569  ORF Transcript_56298/g.161569 Transcript_56298/m.161569 type:complete len:221 (-) Transcript_56298:64-726(-)
MGISQLVVPLDVLCEHILGHLANFVPVNVYPPNFGQLGPLAVQRKGRLAFQVQGREGPGRRGVLPPAPRWRRARCVIRLLVLAQVQARQEGAAAGLGVVVREPLLRRDMFWELLDVPGGGPAQHGAVLRPVPDRIRPLLVPPVQGSRAAGRCQLAGPHPVVEALRSEGGGALRRGGGAGRRHRARRRGLLSRRAAVCLHLQGHIQANTLLDGFGKLALRG